MPGIYKDREIGRLLKIQRTRRGLSISRLAELSGVGKATISRWESGEYLPDIPLLDSVLHVLDIGSEERREMLDRIGRPRAVREIREADQADFSAAADYGVSAPAPGDLLRAMRRRKRLTLDQFAEALGVTPGAASHWESSHRFPDRDTLSRIYALLEAGTAEQTALARRDFAIAKTDDQDTLAEVQELCVHRFGPIRETPGFWTNLDLRFLILEDRMWRIARRDGEAVGLLASLYGRHAYFLGEMERFQEAAEIGRKAMDLAPESGDFFGDTMSDALTVVAYRKFLGRDARTVRRSVEIIEDCLPHVRNVQGRMFERHMLARYYGALGMLKEAAALVDQIAEIAESSGDKAGEGLAVVTQGVALLESGNAAEAVPTLSSYVWSDPKRRFNQCYDCARAFIQVGEPAEARAYLDESYWLAQEHGFPTTEPDQIRSILEGQVR